MPNWCENYLEITGPAGEVRRFRQEVRGDVEFDFETILPTPPEMSDGSSSEGRNMPDWWDWRTSSSGWSTKWGVDIINEDPVEEGFCWYFHSAWSPPEAIIFQLGAMYPALRFQLRYAESGSFFAGSLIINRGEVEEDICYDSNSAEELYQFVREYLGQDWQEWEEEDE